MDQIHDLHTYEIATDQLPANWWEAVPRELFAVEIDKELVTEPDGTLLVFTDPWRAARYLEHHPARKGSEGFGFEPLTASEIWAQNARWPAVSVNPCCNCGFKHVLSLSKGSASELDQQIQALLAEDTQRYLLSKADVEDYMAQADYTSALDLAAEMVRHQEAGDPDLHQIIADSAKALGEDDLYQRASENLELFKRN